MWKISFRWGKGKSRSAQIRNSAQEHRQEARSVWIPGVQKPRGRTARGPKRSKERDPTLGAHGVLEPEPQDRIRKIILATP